MVTKIHTKKIYLYCISIVSIALLLAMAYLFLQRDTSVSYESTSPATINSTDEEPLLIPKPQTEVKEKFFGYSTKGRSIYGYEIGRGKETVFLFGAIHGDEKNTADLLNKFVEEVRANPESISDSKKLVVIPIVNPDGYYERSDNLNVNGVNLNRNFDAKEWKPYEQEGVSAGSKPFSEDESIALKQTVERYRPEVMIAFHSQGGLVSPEENESSIALAKWYEKKTGYSYYDEWTYVGTATLWFWETFQKPSITVELTDHVENDWELNKEALWALVSSETLPFKNDKQEL